MKKILALLFILSLCPIALAMDYEDLNSVKDPAYRVGTSNDVENRFENVKATEVERVRKSDDTPNIENLTYADLSIKKIAKEISKDLDADYDAMLSDLSLLWQGAATKSDTVKFALYKLSNPDADKPNDKSIKKVLTTIASMSSLVGAGMGDPLIATGAFVGGNILGIMSQDDKAMNYKYTKVNDADMIILVRKVDQLQQNVVSLYYDYLTTRKMFDMAVKMTKYRYQNYEQAQGASREIVIIADAYYRESLDLQMKTRNDFYAKRASLEQLVGNDIFKQFEASINSRD